MSRRSSRSQLTGFGTALVVVLLIGATNPPQTSDPQVAALLFAGVVAVLVVGIAWPAVAVRRIRVEASSPRDLTVGQQAPIDLRLSGVIGSCEVRLLDPEGPWHRVDRSGRGVVSHLAERRGVFHGLGVAVRVSAPFGVFSAQVHHHVELPHVVEVAPRPMAVDWLPSTAEDDGSQHAATAHALGGDLVRSVRPYAPGDPAHLVHWPTSARAGTLVVRELEPPTPLAQAIVVDLRDLAEQRERAASYAFGAARAVLAAGGELLLCTAEPAGPVTARAASVREAGRRLARAVEGEPGQPPRGWPVVEIGR